MLNLVQRVAQLERELAAKDAEVARIPGLERTIALLTEQVAVLLKRIADLQRESGKNSTNSNKPPSSDPPAARKKRRKREGKDGTSKPRGGQPGHPGSFRALLPESEVTRVDDRYPCECQSCWKGLPKIPDPNATRVQSVEIPEIKLDVTEVRYHEVECPHCGYKTRANREPDKIPPSPFGPRLMSVVAVLTGTYHISRRRTQNLLSDLFGLRLSLGAVSSIEARASAAIEKPVEEAWTKAKDGEVKHADGTGWKQAGASMAVWVVATNILTVFKVVQNSTMETLKKLLGPLKGILVSDRATALMFWQMDRRQICWAHLLRKFVSFAELDGRAGEIGRELLDYTGLLFEYWHDFKKGKISRDLFRAWMAPIREQVEALLQKAVEAQIDGLSGSCANMLEHKAALWTFVDHAGVEPTNNHGEQELRTFVLWRKRSFGSQSERGNVFAERMMTVTHTARKQKRNVLEFVTACFRAQAERTTPPSLFVAGAAA